LIVFYHTRFSFVLQLFRFLQHMDTFSGRERRCQCSYCLLRGHVPSKLTKSLTTLTLY